MSSIPGFRALRILVTVRCPLEARMERMPLQRAGGIVTACGLLLLLTPPVEGRVLAASHPTPASLVTTSSANMLALHSVHTSATVSLWSSGTNGNHIPVSVSEAITGDCSRTTTGTIARVATRFHAVGERTVGGHRTNRINTTYITIASGPVSSTGSGRETLRVWERSTRTHMAWRKLAGPPVQETAYSLGDTAECPSDQSIRIITARRFTLVGTTSVSGRPSWSLHGQVTTGDTTDVRLTVDQLTRLWNRMVTTLIVRNKGTVINRLPTVITYSRFDVPLTISAPTSTSRQPTASPSRVVIVPLHPVRPWRVSGTVTLTAAGTQTHAVVTVRHLPPDARPYMVAHAGSCADLSHLSASSLFLPPLREGARGRAVGTGRVRGPDASGWNTGVRLSGLLRFRDVIVVYVHSGIAACGMIP